MKKLLVILSLACWIPIWAEDETEPVEYGSMFNWENYYSYYHVTDIIKTSNSVFCLSDGALFSLDIDTKEVVRWTKKEGLHSGNIRFMSYSQDLDKVFLVYENNMLDVIDKNGNIEPIRDLYQTTSKAITIQCCFIHQKTAYLGTNFGIIAINLSKLEVADTYYIGPDAQDVSISNLAVANDSLFAQSQDVLYKASLTSNLLSYTVWSTEPLGTGTWSNLTPYQEQLWAINDTNIFVRENGLWELVPSSDKWEKLTTDGKKLYAIDDVRHIYEITNKNTLAELYTSSNVNCAVYDNVNHIYWLGLNSHGIGSLKENAQAVDQTFMPDGPIRNDIYSLTFAGEKLFICPGYRWADRGKLDASFAFLNPDGTWGYESYWHTSSVLGTYIMDLVAVGVDPNDNSHFFMSSYGFGVIEYRNNQVYKQYTEGTQGCTLNSLVEGNPQYVRTDAATIDNQGYLWVLQPGDNVNTVHVMNLNSRQWTCFNLYSHQQRIIINVPKGIWIDQRYDQRKWMIAQRSGACIAVLDDNGTPTIPSDDHSVAYSSMVDQNNNTISFNFIYDMAQDHNGDMWVGLEGGLIIIPSSTEIMTSNQCKRVIIPRNDGTGLADYLLANDNVRAIAVDGGNRKWLGTENSGVYLVSPDGMTTIYHFTEENSPLPSNNITDIAIHPTTGEVFIGTSAGLVSYRSDASEAFEDYSNIIAYPNPIRPNYDGVVTISGLTEGTVVNIIDQGGQLVCKTNANGGIAVWDLKNGDGKRVSSGIYSALCNDTNGKHQLVKIMVMNR